MLRIATVLAALAAFPAVAFGGARNETPSLPLPTARLLACDVTSADREATFYGRMDTIPGASRMQIRFQLLERLGRDDDWSKVDVPALRQWHTSQAGVKRFGWKQTVDALRLGGAYRARVQYRWLAASGTVLDSFSRDTPVCRGPLPNLILGDLTVRPGPSADTSVYRVDISNRGKLDAEDVEVALNVDKAVLDTVTLPSVEAGETRSVTFTGPLCRRAARVRVDPDNLIGETIEEDNSELFSCPA